MKNSQRFAALVRLSDVGGWESITLLDNDQLLLHDIRQPTSVPDFMSERIALLSLCEVNKSEQGEVYGRRINRNELLVYLSYNEYRKLRSIGVQT